MSNQALFKNTTDRRDTTHFFSSQNPVNRQNSCVCLESPSHPGGGCAPCAANRVGAARTYAYGLLVRHGGAVPVPASKGLGDAVAGDALGDARDAGGGQVRRAVQAAVRGRLSHQQVRLDARPAGLISRTRTDELSVAWGGGGKQDCLERDARSAGALLQQACATHTFQGNRARSQARGDPSGSAKPGPRGAAL